MAAWTEVKNVLFVIFIAKDRKVRLPVAIGICRERTVCERQVVEPRGRDFGRGAGGGRYPAAQQAAEGVVDEEGPSRGAGREDAAAVAVVGVEGGEDLAVGQGRLEGRLAEFMELGCNSKALLFKEAFDHPYTALGLQRFQEFWDQTPYE